MTTVKSSVESAKSIAERTGQLTLLTGLILLLVGGQEHVVWQRASSDSTLGSHAVRFACQRPGAGLAVGQDDTTLPLDVNGT